MSSKVGNKNIWKILHAGVVALVVAVIKASGAITFWIALRTQQGLLKPLILIAVAMLLGLLMFAFYFPRIRHELSELQRDKSDGQECSPRGNEAREICGHPDTAYVREKQGSERVVFNPSHENNCYCPMCGKGLGFNFEIQDPATNGIYRVQFSYEKPDIKRVG